MRGKSITRYGVILISAFVTLSVHAQQQSNSPTFNQSYEAAFRKATEECGALWSDHAFDELRTRVPLVPGESPTFSMLTNTEKLQPKDKPLADLAIKTVQKCRELYKPVYSMLPPQGLSMIQGVERQQDALIAQLYRGTISLGEYNVAMDKLTGALMATLSGIPTTPQVPAATLPVTKSVVAPATISKPRLALVIGNSAYVNLPRLRNPTNDARAVAAIFQKMGYRTQLVLDATEQNIRTEVRKFANESEKVDTAIVFYAGHGAQVNGSNYLLPVDIDVPRTDADIQFTGLKVDDLVNSIRSSTKIVFLDACRDNPVLFKNIVSGRGGHPIGLAPASASSFDQKPGGGVFIAYATDAGSVADDGQGQHSPFTQALLRNLQKPMSIDDMFSLVTKEVRLVTKHAQKPYKYASLENIICVAPCSNSSTVTTTDDVVQEAKQSETDELQIALQTKNIDALETYLQKYPDSPKRVEIDNAMDELKRSEFTEWTLYAYGLHNEPWYMQVSSIQQYGDKVAVKIKAQIDPTSPKIFFGKSLPNAEYFEDISVFDCKKPKFATSEETILDKSDAVLYHYKFADPRYLDLSKGQEVGPTSIASAGRNIVCHPEIRTPIAKVRLTKMDFKSLGSTSAGDGNLLYEPLQSISINSNQKELLFIFSFFDDKPIPLPPTSTVKDPPKYRTEVDNLRLLCAEGRVLAVRNEYFDASNNLVHLELTDPSLPIKNWIEIKLENLSPLSALHRIFCGEEFSGIGIQIRIDNSVVKVGKVIEDTPAARAGIKENDIITHLDNQPLAGLTLDQVVEKIRGPANSKVTLKILRSGQDSPLDLVVSREAIRSQPLQEQVTK